MAVTLAELARRFGAQLRGIGEAEITGVAALDRAGPTHISYLSDPKHRPHLATTRAGAVLLTAPEAAEYRGNALIVEQPRLCFARVAAFLHAGARPRAGIHPSAVVDPSARVAATAAIGPYAVVEAGAVIGENAEIGPGCYIGAAAAIGPRTRLVARVWVGSDSVLGSGCLVHPGAVIGSDGFGYVNEDHRWIKVPQLGRTVVGSEVEIGSNTTIDRGALSDTEIGDGVKIDNLVQVAHNVRIGEHTIIAACVGIAGSATIGRRCRIGGQVGIAGHLSITDDVEVLGTSLIMKSIKEPGTYSSALKAEPAASWRRQVVRLRQLDETMQRVRQLEQEIRNLKGESS